MSQSRGHVVQACSAPTDPSSLSCAMKDPSVESVMKIKWQQTTPTKKIEEIQLVNVNVGFQLSPTVKLTIGLKNTIFCACCGVARLQ